MMMMIIIIVIVRENGFDCVVVDSKDSQSCQSAEAGLPLELSPLQTITSALSLTAQLVSLLACYLDVILPQRLHYRYC